MKILKANVKVSRNEYARLKKLDKQFGAFLSYAAHLLDIEKGREDARAEASDLDARAERRGAPGLERALEEGVHGESAARPEQGQDGQARAEVGPADHESFAPTSAPRRSWTALKLLRRAPKAGA